MGITTSTESALPSSERARFKYNRKFKPPSTESSKLTTKSEKNDTRGSSKRTLSRTSYYSRLRNSRTEKSSTLPSIIESNNKTEIPNSAIKNNKNIFKRPLYVSRLRTSKDVITTEPNVQTTSAITTEELNNENPVSVATNEIVSNKPLLYIHSRNLNSTDSMSLDAVSGNEDLPINDNIEMVILLPKNTVENNEIINKSEESDNVELIQMMTTPKYHASYKDFDEEFQKDDKPILSSKIPPIRNIQSHKYAGRKQNDNELFSNDEVDSTPKSRVTNNPKYIDSFSRQPTTVTNGVSLNFSLTLVIILKYFYERFIYVYVHL